MSQAPIPLDGRRRREVPLRISQVFSACTFCKARKIKCDGIAPICGGCTKFGRGSTCSLASKSVHGRDYPTHLQTKIQRLQAELQRCQNNSSSPVPHDCDASDDQGHQASMIDNLIAEIGALPILASSYASSFDGPSLSTVVLAAASKSPLSSLSSITLPNNPRDFLPKQNTALKLVQHYITHIYPRLPFFSIQGFWAQFNHVYAVSSIPLAGTMIQSPTYEAANGLLQEAPEINRVRLSEGTSFFTVLLVLAISTSSLSRSTADPAKRLFHAAMTFREAAVLPNTIGGVQSILFLIQFATLNPSILDAWYLIGVGMRNCVDLGLHQDPSKPISPSLLETRRRLWWSMYSFDRSMSLGCGRPTEIADAVISAHLPSFKIESNATEVEVEGYLQRYRVLRIQSLIYDRLSNMSNADNDSNEEIVVKLRAKLTAWRQDNSPLHSQTLVDSEWLMGKILLLRPCRRIPERRRGELAELWESALGFVALYRELVESNSIFYVQIASEKVYWTGLAMLYSYWRLRESVDGEPKTTAIRPVDLWMAIQDVTFILRTLSERWDDGKTLATEFEATSGRVVALMEAGGDADNLAAILPVEVVNFKDYASLTSIRISATGARICGMGISEADDELQGLISEMIWG
ncbi:fungal-specific transcription factor domain-containing protein [Dactylonectria macrodidyma]|uniref:Fungal-specific transcription factor domain-containing protein n=1 Tax=Dactylonectria macrodidyma TaxID=307937 RepID=A0A9P9DM25_9HYPO|nr:fungal-specific transcription factor domain-containing protein [Dactylonectria macrodidyma]